MAPTPITASEFNARTDLPDWRFQLQCLHATFRARSFEGATSFAAQVAAAAEAADHHPDIDIRYPDRVHVVLTTHAAGGRVTELDVDLAGEISELAASSGATSEPTAAQVLEIAIDAMDIPRVRPFWAAVTGYRDDGDDALVDPVRVGPAIWFQQMDEPRLQRNRIHLDLTVPRDVADERVAAALAAGGTLVSDADARAFWVLADPEGNEVCICTCDDRD